VFTLPSLRTGRHDLRDFTKTPSLIAAGREAGRAMVAAAAGSSPAPAPAAALRAVTETA